MFKTYRPNEVWLIQQHHHAAVSGHLAAHWGGTFAAIGAHPGASGSWRDEVVLGIAEHDNGWWETEAMPSLGADGLPIGVSDLSRSPDESDIGAWAERGFERWVRGVRRLEGTHPYAALLVAMHAYWLYAPAFDDLHDEYTPFSRHPVFGDPDVGEPLVRDQQRTRAYLDRMQAIIEDLVARISRDPLFAGALAPRPLHTHLRLLQVLDAMSLLLATGDQEERVFEHIPRASWEDRVAIAWRPRSATVIELDPYPFASHPLRVPMPARIAPRPLPDHSSSSAFHALPPTTLEFVFVGPKD